MHFEIPIPSGIFARPYSGDLTSMSAIRPILLFVLTALLATPAAYADDVKGNAANGRELFMANACPTCHSVIKEDDLKVGPNLVGVVGRKAGTTKSLMGPSENLKKYGVIWSAETLDAIPRPTRTPRRRAQR